MPLTNLELIKGIKEKDKLIVESLYVELLPQVERYVLRNSGNQEEALDIFQEAFMVFYEKLQQESISGEVNVRAYITAICKNLWLINLRKKKLFQEKKPMLKQEDYLDGDKILTDITNRHRFNLYRNHFESLGNECRKVLQLFLDKHSLKDIAEKMAYTVQYAKKKKYICQKKLIESIKLDPLYEELKME